MRQGVGNESQALQGAERLKLAVSACVLGQPVRYNGGHKRSALCVELLGQAFDFVPLCPEVGVGLGTPRPPIRLVGSPDSPRAVGVSDASLDVTERLQEWAERAAATLSGVSGAILMQRSPSCGLFRVKVYRQDDRPPQFGSGIFAAALARRLPELPIEEEGRLHDPVLLENFVVRVRAYGEWQRLLAEGFTRGAIVAFHSRYKYLLLAHDPAGYRTLGRLVAELGKEDPETFAAHYFPAFMAALRRRATRGTHANVLQHLAGYLRRVLPAEERQELQELITQYREGVVPLVAPLVLLRHHLRRHPDPYLAQQVYLEPHPPRLGLRNAL